jgi:hypothetical protein
MEMIEMLCWLLLCAGTGVALIFALDQIDK